MPDKTLNDFMPLLKQKQQEYIVYCVIEYGDRPDFHRGLLPFLSATEAARCLKYKLENIKQGVTELEGVPIIGIKFIRGIISIFEGALIHKLSEDEESVTMSISDVRLKKFYQARFSKSFCAKIETEWHGAKPADKLIQLDFVEKDTWKVTTHKKSINRATTWLAETFR